MVKIKALLEGLSGKGISLNTRALAQFTADNGVLVTVRCGRPRGRVSLPPKLLGLQPDKWDKESQNFFSTHVAMGQLTMVPKELDARLNQLDTRARRLAQSYTVNGSYMLLSDYDEFRDAFEEIRDEYLATIARVADQWDDIRDTFIEGVRATVEARGRYKLLKRDRVKMVDEIIRAIPSADEYRSGAYMTLEVRAFPTTGSATAPGLAPDTKNVIDQTWRDDVTANVIRAIETGMGEIFEQASKIAKGYAASGKIDSRSLLSLNRKAERVKKMNIFCNPLLEAVATRLSKLVLGDPETTEMQVEDAILDIWEYAVRTGVNLDLDVCPFSEDDLNNLLAVRNSAGDDDETAAS